MSDYTHQLNQLLEQPIFNDLNQNISNIDRILENCSDLIRRELIFHGSKESIEGVLFYIDGLVNDDKIETSILQPLMVYARQLKDKLGQVDYDEQISNQLMKNLLLTPSIEIVQTFEKSIEGLLVGNTLLFLDHCDQAILFQTKGVNARNVEEPQTEVVVRGPRDGFTENISTNTSLIRRRIKDPLLRIEKLTSGKRTKTDINIVYLKEIAQDGIVEEIKNRINKIDIDAIIGSGYIEELIGDSPLSIFTTIQATERPDKVVGSILEGRIAILVDNTPFVLIAPANFWSFLQAPDDYYSRYWVASFYRFIRFIALLISLTLSSLYVMLVTFHFEMMPTTFAITIAAGREAVPFPVIVEILLMELAFEIMREAGLRLPRPVGQAVSIVGSLVIGQAAVQAGVVSPIMVILVAITGISSFAIPSYATSLSIRLLRFPLLIASGTVGLLGFAAVLTLILLHILSLRSFGEPFFSPLAPYLPTDAKDSLIRKPWWALNTRPQMAQGELERQDKSQMPKPPSQKRKRLFRR